MGSFCLAATAQHPKQSTPLSSSHANETVRIYENGRLVKVYQTGLPVVVNLDKYGNGQGPINEAIHIQEHGPNSQAQEVIQFSQQSDNMKNKVLFDHMMHDQQHEEVMMQQFFNQMNHYLNTEAERVGEDEQIVTQQPQAQPEHMPRYESHWEKSMKTQDQPQHTDSWWDLFKHYF